MDINELRKDIDRIDEELVSLIRERMETAAKIGEYKRENNLPVYDPARERELFARVGELAGEDFASYTKVLYSTMTDVSRSYQRKLMGRKSGLSERMQKAIDGTDKLFPQGGVVACQGVEGAYSQLACEKLFKNPSIMYFGGFEDVFRAVDKKLCRYGVLPIENSTAGSVNKIYDLMSKFKFHIVRSVRIQVGHALLAKRGASLSDIKEIYSHEQAINQCSEFLAAHKDIKINICENTAVAARLVSESGRNDIAALSSPGCAELYDLSTLVDNVCDHIGNYTRFICISRDLEIYPGSDKTSIMMKIPHKPGSLYRIMARFNALGLNLEKLESRPKPGSDFEFMFYFDIGASIYSPELFELICELEDDLDGFKYLGSYTEIV
ncbi:MAG: bifunctional chorismate mutase/prephenate dehydratase [Ruminococcaceae bacterium]|nr:bifunctional chorismate mutase/prephenate dehydratase [Oscillospiraceae bacterium]